MNDPSPTLEAVDVFIRSRQRGLTFPPWLEDQFESDTRRRRSQRLRAAMVPNAIVYNLFLIPDWFLIRDRFWLAVLLHAAVVTPWIFAIGWLAEERRSRLIRELATASMPIVIVLQIICTFLLFTRCRSLPVFCAIGCSVHEHNPTLALSLRSTGLHTYRLSAKYSHSPQCTDVRCGRRCRSHDTGSGGVSYAY
jgi:hypothetical protein